MRCQRSDCKGGRERGRRLGERGKGRKREGGKGKERKKEGGRYRASRLIDTGGGGDPVTVTAQAAA